MKELLPYIVKGIFCGGFFYTVYKLLIDGRAGYTFCRVYLLTAMLLVAIIPVVNIAILPPAVITIPSGYNIPVNIITDIADIPAPELLPTDRLTITEYVSVGSYFMVAVVLAYYFITGLIGIRYFRKRSRMTRTSFYRLYENNRIISPFSFFSSIFISDECTEPDRSQIIGHELGHIRHGHSAEKMAAEILKILLWFNPFIWLMRNSLNEVHEYQADMDVIESGYDPAGYKTLIVRQLFGCNPDLTNGLAQSRTKKRLIMITSNNKRKRTNALRAALLPVTAFCMLALLSFTSKPTVYITEESDANQNTLFSIRDGKVTMTDGGNIYTADLLKYQLPGTNFALSGKEGTMELIHGDMRLKAENIILSGQPDEPVKPKGKGAEDVIVTGYQNLAGSTATSLLKSLGEELNTGNKTGDPVILLDGKEIDHAALEAINVNTINSVTVLKDKTVEELGYIEKYGEGARNGIIIIELKIDAEPAGRKPTAFERGFMERTGSEAHLILYDGKVITEEQFKNIDPNSIESVSVLKGKTAEDLGFIEKYGEKARNGIIVITSKEAAKSGSRNNDETDIPNVVGTFKRVGDEPFISVEVMPVFNEGENGDLVDFRNWVSKQIIYPHEAWKEKITGRVVISFVVEKDGTIGDIEVLRSPHKLLSDETVRVISSSPEWEPGYQRGKPQRVKFTLPVEYQLTGGDED